MKNLTLKFSIINLEFYAINEEDMDIILKNNFDIISWVKKYQDITTIEAALEFFINNINKQFDDFIIKINTECIIGVTNYYNFLIRNNTEEVPELTARQKQTCLLHYVGNMNVPEIAEAYKISKTRVVELLHNGAFKYCNTKLAKLLYRLKIDDM